ncbi:reductase [Streptomyces sp. NPDC055254]
MRNVCVIGGSRYFGKDLVTLLRDAGAEVTVVNRGSVAPPPGVDHVVADRDDERQLGAALGSRTFDAVVDQVCYGPEQARTARRVFAGRTGRYVMTSTIEVYDPATLPAHPATLPAHPTTLPSGRADSLSGAPLTEEHVDPAGAPAPGIAAGAEEATAYAEGKRQAEAVFLTDPAFPFVSVRTAHVLGGGRREFTGRLAHYAERIASGVPVAVHENPYPTSFAHYRETAEFLRWAAGASFTGPVNACSHGTLTVTELCELVAAHVGRRPRYETVAPGAAASPFSFDRGYAMDNGRATRLGFDFGQVTDWMPGAVVETVHAAQEAGGRHV